MNSSNMPSKSGKEEEAVPCHTESNDQKKKRKRRDTHAVIEEDSTSIKHAKTEEKKKKKKNKDAIVLHEPNGHPIGSFELEDIIAGFLSSRGLHSTLSVFVSETQHEYTKRAHTVQLEDIYHYYLNRIYENPMEQKAETNFCKNVDTEFNEEDAKRKKNKATFRGNGDAEIISSSGSDKGAIEKDLYRSDKNKEFATEAMDNFSGQAHKRKTGKAENNSEIVAGTCKGEIKLSKAPNESEQVLEFDESVCELQKNKGKKKKVALEERTLTGNEEQISSKKNKIVKIMPENKLQSTESCILHRKAANENIAPLTNIPDRLVDIAVPKKNKKMKLHDMSPRVHEQLIFGKKNKKGKMTVGNSQSTESHATNKESKEEGLGNLSEDTRKLQDFEVKEENKKEKSTEITLKDHSKISIHKKNMKEKKDFEKLQACSNAGNGAKEIREYVFEDNDSTQNISQAHMAIEANKSITSESVVSKNDSTVPAYKNRGAPGEQGGDKDTKANVSPDLKDSQRKLETPKIEKSFQRVKVKEVYFSDPRLRDNSYWGKDGAENGYGARAQEVLGRVKGKDFQHEKTKKKRGSYTGGMIDLQSHSIKFSYSDEE